MRDATTEAGADGVDRIAGARDQDDIARIDKRQMNVPDSFLRADQGQHFVGRIQRHIETSFVPVGHRGSERQHPFVGGILMVLGVLGRQSQAFDNRSRRRQIRIADAEVDDIDALSNRRLLHLVDGGKQIGRKCFNSGCDFNWKTGHGAECSFSRMNRIEVAAEPLGYFRNEAVINVQNQANGR